MIFWHLSGPFDLAENNQAVHIWLMHGSFFAAGVLFWLQFIPSPPFRRRMPLVSQAAALLGTNVIMIGLAMALSIFVTHSVYTVYDHVPGVTLPPYADQQIGAAILWVCGDFWALPTMIITVRRLIAADGTFGAALDRALNRGSSRSVPGGWGRPAVGAGVRGPTVRGWAVRGAGVGGAGVGGAGVGGAGVGGADQRPSPPDGES
jgi:Cytochrome c oxidase caa3 assembly factor (Caa3_CtaG)